jgi:hypothetical protein
MKLNHNLTLPPRWPAGLRLSDTRQGIAHIGVGGFTARIRRITPMR